MKLRDGEEFLPVDEILDALNLLLSQAVLAVEWVSIMQKRVRKLEGRLANIERDFLEDDD